MTGLFILTLLSGCAGTSQSQTDENYLLGAFNLRNFGPSRIENPAALMGLVTILKRYDLVLLMEIRDSSQQAQATLLESVNAVSDHEYKLLLSERLGRNSYKEQYGLLYRPDKVNINDHYTYDDGLEPHQDLFEREPIVSHISMGGIDFNLIGLHADPESVALELNRLLPVYEDSVLRNGEPDAILLGDLNADCAYLTDEDSQYILLLNHPDFVWLIDDDQDTTSSSSHCAYDRIIITRDLIEHQLPEAQARIYNFQSELKLSDELTAEISNHYPVELLFSATSQ